VGIKWRDTLNIGVEEIDNQHQELFRRFDLFLNACESGEGIAKLNELLDFLAEYVQFHFHDEEQTHLQHCYPLYEEHRKLHARFIDDFSKMQEGARAEGVALHHIIDTNNLLFKWIINHISKADKEFGDFIKHQEHKK
jgi:hemerythrin